MQTQSRGASSALAVGDIPPKDLPGTSYKRSLKVTVVCYLYSFGEEKTNGQRQPQIPTQINASQIFTRSQAAKKQEKRLERENQISILHARSETYNRVDTPELGGAFVCRFHTWRVTEARANDR